ncbi:MAG: endonuclease I [Bacteroidia bacterium]|jgi:endonuclease I
MRKITCLLIFIAAFASAQVTLSVSQLDFGDVLTTADKELVVNVTNTTSSVVTIDAVNIYNTDFTHSLPSASIAAGATEVLRVTFKPRHNLAYNSELIFVLADGSEFRIDLIGNGKYEGTYYSATFNKSYQDLKDELKTILAAGYTNLGYTGARDNMYGDIDNVAGKVTCVYTGREATFNTRSGANSSSFNCEHTWPQSLFSSNEPEKADIHHLFPTDVNANSRRGSYPFGVVTGTPSWTEGGSKLGGSLFEPRDEQKGATARAMIYFAIRYQDYSNFIDGQEALLKQWHIDNQPTAWDVQRNEKIFGYQKNRNPFVDHPEFIERINTIGATDTKPVIKEAEIAQSAIDYGFVRNNERKNIYITNTGNTNWTGVSAASTSGNNLKIVSSASSVAAGEALQIVVDFLGVTDGDYTDNLIIDLKDEAGKTITIPVRFSIGTASTVDIASQELSIFYDGVHQNVVLTKLPAGAVEVQVWNSAGQQILLNDISSVLTDIPFHGHSQGLYFVVIKTKTDAYTAKFLVY